MKTTYTFFSVLLLFTLGRAQNLNDGLRGFYTFTGFNNTDDTSGNDQHGTLHGAATVLDNFVLTVPEDDVSYLELPHQLLDGAEDFTVSFQVSLGNIHTGTSDQLPVNAIVMGARDGMPNAFAITYRGITQQMQITIDDVGYLVDTELEQGVEYCIAVTRHDGMVRYYQDGEELGPGQYLPTPLGIAPGSLVVGQELDCVGGCFLWYQSMSGTLDYLRIYDRAIDPVEAPLLCREPEPTATATLPTDAVQLFPNPVRDGHLVLRANVPFARGTVRLYDLRGRTVLTTPVRHTAKSIHVGNLPSGTYLVQVATDAGIWAGKVLLLTPVP